MKVLVINGSPEIHGCTDRALQEVERVLAESGIGCVRVDVGKKDVRGCIACRTCRKTNKCIFNDIVNETAPILEECDGLLSVLRRIMPDVTDSCWRFSTVFSIQRPGLSTKP